MKSLFRMEMRALVLLMVLPIGSYAQDFNAQPFYGEINLAAGFQPDPMVRTLSAGGSQAVSDQGAGCTGYVTGAPDFRLNYTSGTYSLGIFAKADVDTTLLVRSPDGSWHCNDDSEFAGGVNPGVSITSPASGRYEIWVGVYSSGSSLTPATLVITEQGTGSWATLDLGADQTPAVNTSVPIRWFGDDSGIWPHDGVCDDGYYTGAGMGSVLLSFNRFRDASDCRQQFELGRIQLASGNHDIFNESLSSGDARHTTRDTYQDSFQVVAQPEHIGQRLVAHMRADSFDNYLIIRSPSGVESVNDDHMDTRNSMLDVLVTETGTYQIIATSYDSGATGSYSLEISKLSVAQPLDVLSSRLIEERLTASSRQQDDSNYVYATEFLGRQGQSLDVIMRSSAFDSYLYLYGPDNLIESNDDFENGNNDSRINKVLPSTGVYALIASTYSGGSTGAFTLAINRPEPVQVPAQVTQPEPEQQQVVREPVVTPSDDIARADPSLTLPTTANIQYGSKRP